MINKGNLQKALNEAKNDTNNAVAYVYSNATSQGNGILKDCVYSLKNNYATSDSVSHASSHILEHFQPFYDATIVKLLQQAGATLAFKTHLDEFGLGGTGTYSNFGIVTNPLNHNHYVGGSSCGSAATLTENVSFAIGSDTGDSVRNPAGFVGKVGFKPSYGAVSRYGLFAFATSLDTVGWLTHNVSDAFEVSQVLFKDDFSNDNTSKDLHFEVSEIKSLKPTIVSYLDCFDYIDPEVARDYQKLLDKLTSEGVKLHKIAVDKDLLDTISVVYQVISFTEASSNLANLSGVHFGDQISEDNWTDTYIKTRQKGLGLMVQRRLILGSYYLERENQEKYLLKAQKMRRVIANYFTEIHSNSDIFIYPASKSSAPALDQKFDENFMDSILTNSNLTGNPSITIPMGKTKNNLPFSIALDAKKFSDVKLLQHALYIEKLLGGK